MLKKQKSRRVSWTETFHPESARQLSVVGGVDGNANANETTTASVAHGGATAPPSTEDRWGVVWAEATLVDDIDSSDTTNANANSSSISTTMKSDDMKVAEAVEVSHQPARPIQDPLKTYQNKLDEEDQHYASAVAALSDSSPPTPCSRGNPFVVLLGLLVTMTAVLSIWALDLMAAVTYILACAFYHLSEQMKKAGGLAMLLYWIFLPVYSMLMLTDGICLSVSVLLAEIFGVLAFLLCGLFGGCDVAGFWWLYIRRLCHLTRWAVRGFHEGWVPERVFPVG